jgi:hypothetical protein
VFDCPEDEHIEALLWQYGFCPRFRFVPKHGKCPSDSIHFFRYLECLIYKFYNAEVLRKDRRKRCFLSLSPSFF